MKIYIASKFENPRAPEVAAQLEAAGHIITYKWWANSDVTEDQALLDFLGVIHADALVLIVEEDLRYSGALTEFGIALGRGIPVHIMGHELDCVPVRGSRPNIFTMMPFGVQYGIETLLQATHAVPA